MTDETIRYGARSQALKRIKKARGADGLQSFKISSAGLPNMDGDGTAHPRKGGKPMGVQNKEAMPDWWHRWEKAIRDYRAVNPRERSLNKISLKAGFTRAAYLSETLNKQKMPGVDSFLAVCEAIDVSPVSILLGFDWTEREQKAVELIERLPPEWREMLFDQAEQKPKALLPPRD